MINGKVKEWHLDQALLQKIAANGSIDISTILEDYLKKTDIITREQLEPTLFDDVSDDIQNLQDALDAYRMKDTAITLEDIDSVFNGLLNTLEERLSTVESNINGAVNIEAFINQAIAEQLNLSIDDAIGAVLTDTVNNAVDTKINDLLESEEDLRLQDKINDSIQNAIQNPDIFNSLHNTILDSVADTFVAKDQLASTEEISDLQNTINDLNDRIDDFQEELENNFVIKEENLDEELTEKINSAYSNAKQLSQQDFVIKKDGESGQILIYDKNNELNASDILLQLNIAQNNLDLNEQEAALVSEIYDTSTMTRYYINRDKWNVNLYRNSRMETVPEIPTPETVDVIIRTNDAAKVFDDTELTDQRYTITGWPEDTTDILNVTVTGSQTEIGESENTFVFEIVENDIPTKYEYNVEVSYGILTVVETEEELEELLNPPTDTESDDIMQDDNTDNQDNPDTDDALDDINESNDSENSNDGSNESDDNDNSDTSEDSGDSIDPDTPIDPEDPGEPEEPINTDTELEYIDFNLANENLQVTGTTVTIDNGTISCINESLVDVASVCFGFYGTRIKLFTTITSPAEPTKEVIKSYVVKLDTKTQYDEEYHMGQECENACFLCVEELSEGAHRVEFIIPAGTEFKLNAKVSLDNEHSGLLQAEHIKLEDFYNDDIFDTGDYVTEQEYEELKSENVSVITINDYASEIIDFDTINRRLIYAANSRILYYCHNNTFLALTNNNSSSGQSSINPDDLNRLEAQLQAYVDNKFAQFVDADSTPF